MQNRMIAVPLELLDQATDYYNIKKVFHKSLVPTLLKQWKAKRAVQNN